MPEITKNDDNRSVPVPAYVWTALAFLTVGAYFLGLTIPFVGPDEARFAQIAREMLERGDWITPTLGGFHWFEKPPLLYWLEIASYKSFGVNEFAARLGPAMFGLGTVFSLWIIGRSVSQDQRSRTKGQRFSPDFANWLALIGASTLGIVVFARGASFDIIITFPVTAALVSFFLFDQAKSASFRTRHLPLILFYAFIGIAILAKGLIGVVLPFAIVGLFYVLLRRLPSRAFVSSLLWGTLLAFVIASAWYLPMYQRHGYAFIDEFFVQHHFERFTTNKYQHPQPFYFFFWVLPVMILPWLPFFIGSIWHFGKIILDRRDAETQSKNRTLSFSSSPLLLFSTAWIVVPLAFFSFSGSKLPGYILPAVPAAVILAAIYISNLAAGNVKWRNAILAIAGLTFTGIILILTFTVPRLAEAESVKSLIQAASADGYEINRVITLHTISHNAEFYAAGRLLRTADGRQRWLQTIAEVIEVVKVEGGRPVLVLVPVEYVSQLTNEKTMTTRVIKDNGELAIVAASLK